jgi:anti-anti-sigma factor
MLKPTVQVHNIGGVLVAEFWDCLRLDPAPVGRLRELYESHLASGGRPEVVADLLGVGFAGSSALGNFMALHRLARQRGGRLIFCCVEPTVYEVFRASKLDSLFEFASDRTTAVALADRPSQRAAESAPAGPGDVPRPPKAPVVKSGGNGLLRASQRRKLSEG